uniref:Phospholipase-like protein n=1 Tax=Tanacetum cinerariifolium TaxID=118510 RepID=A0A6L2LGW0_TANCI|nr:phospholipase-like protein [Tanacetum cinerariifolium]
MQEEEFCLVSGLKFGVKNSTDYNKAKDPILFRRRVFSSDLDGRPIRGKDVGLLIESGVFKKLDDNDDVSLCCVGILQLVLLGVDDRRPVPNWILRLANDRVSWDNYPWGSYVWPKLYKHLRDANVKSWQPLYASDPTNETDTKSYSIEGFAWAFKTWILESFRAATDDYYTRYHCHPRIVAWSSKHKFYRHMLKPMLHDNYLLRDWYRMRLRLDRDVPSEMYREFEEQRRGYQQMKEKNDDMYEKITRFMEDMRRVPEANTTPIIVDQHFGTDNYLNYETVDPDKVTRDAYVTMTEFPLDPYDIYLDCYMKGYKLSSFFWPQLVPHLCTYRRERSWSEGWLSSDILIREMIENANWTLAKSGTLCLHQENNRFMILTDPHNIKTLDGSVRPFPSWNDVTWVYMPINVGGVHWVTGAINLADSIFYVSDSMESESRMLMLEQQHIGDAWLL